MATVYSLVCFGGLSDKTVTFTDAGDVVNLTSHGLRQGVTGIVFSTTGSLPTGIVAGTAYYPRDGADANKFTIYPTKADALAGTNQITFTGTGSGTHTVKSAYMLGLTTDELARYGDSGSERIYNGLIAFQTDRAHQPVLGDAEVCEIADAFTETTTWAFAGADLYNASSVTITTRVNGVRSEAWHGGKVDAGYCFTSSNGTAVLNPNTYNMTFDGIRATGTYNGGVRVINPGSTQFNTVVKNCIISGNTGASAQFGAYINSSFSFINNIVYNIGGTGIAPNGGSGMMVCNNIVVKCKKGFDSLAGSSGLFANNIAVGNTVNYEDCPSYQSAKHRNNVGELSDKIVFTASAGSSTLIFASAHGRSQLGVVVFDSTGTLPTVGGVPLTDGVRYVAKTVTSTTMTIANNSSESAFVFDGVGTGTHTMYMVWCSETPLLVDMASPGSLFVDYANNDFRLTAGSPLINAGVDLSDSMDAEDMLSGVRPNYEAATYPDNYWDVGPFEYDHGDGLAPLQVTIAIAGMAEGSVLAIYKISDGSTIVSPTAIGASGIYSNTYSYTGDMLITVVVRKGTSGTRYLPYSAPGLITDNGFSLIVNQIADGVLNG